MMTIGIVALVVIGPERLPAVATKVGRYVGKAQRFVRGVRSDISRELESGDLKKLIGDQKDQIDELRQMVRTATKDIETSTGDAFKDAEKSISELEKSSLAKPAETTAADNTPELLNDPGAVNDAGAVNESGASIEGSGDASVQPSNGDASVQPSNKAS